MYTQNQHLEIFYKIMRMYTTWTSGKGVGLRSPTN